ncbi:MAG: type II secretion system protein [Tissierellales bacterium]|nr:type II secretion system protein [Tissierellales bacterium]MBN2826885.1 type II secretion system protein [Tissierellales bacterium]
MLYNCNAFQSTKKDDKHGQKGYTLIELICVLSLIGIIGLISLPKISYIHDFHLDSISNALLYDIRMIKMKDMSEPKKSYQILLTDKAYQIRYNKGTMPSLLRKVTLDSHYRISFSHPNVWFNANGTPKHAQTITITNTVTGKNHMITINPNTGRILLYE